MRHVRAPVTLGAVIAASATSVALAGSTDPQWSYYKPSNTGIPGDYVQSIFVDTGGGAWVTAYIPFWEEGGVARFDGYRWLTISNVDYPEILSPRFNDVLEDQDGVMWFASGVYGSVYSLLRYDPATDSLHRYDPDNSPMPAGQLYDIDVAPDGTIWMGLEGLVRFDPQAGTWDVWTTANGLPWAQQYPTFSSINFVAVVPGAGGGYTVWFGHNAVGVATYQDGEFFWYGDDVPPGGPVTPTGFVSRDPVDNLGNIWLMTNYGLARRAPGGTFLVTGYPPGLPTGDISTVYAFRDGRAALGTFYGNVYLYDRGWSSLGNWGSFNHTYALAEETGGAIWAGGVGGTARYEQGTWQRYRLTNTGMIGYWIEAITFDDAGNVYMNGNAAPGVGGFDILHPDGTWTNANVLTYGLGLPWPFPTDDTDALCGRAGGNLALAPTWSGLYEWDGTGYQEHLFDMPITHITEDATGRLWAAPSGWHLFRENESGLDHYDGTNSPLPAGDIGDLFPDPGAPGSVWVAAAFGLGHTDGDTWTIYPRELLGLDQYTIDQLIMCADRALDGTLWIGSGLGLFHFDPATLQYTLYDLTNAPLPSQFIHRVEVAPDGSVWISSQDLDYPYAGGLTHFDGESWTTYSQGSSPLPHNQISVLNSRAVAGGYELWIGTASEGIAIVGIQATPGDLDGDGVVGTIDFLALLSAWGPCADCGACPADLDGDCAVGITDFLILLANWG
jgi:ligand-binding sensor domain-containing protein